MKIEDFRINLSFTIEEINMMFKFLEEIPYGRVAGLIEELKKQVDEQLVEPESFDSDVESDTEHPL
jgi:hypothetical protein